MTSSTHRIIVEHIERLYAEDIECQLKCLSECKAQTCDELVTFLQDIYAGDIEKNKKLYSWNDMYQCIGRRIYVGGIHRVNDTLINALQSVGLKKCGTSVEVCAASDNVGFEIYVMQLYTKEERRAAIAKLYPECPYAVKFGAIMNSTNVVVNYDKVDMDALCKYKSENPTIYTHRANGLIAPARDAI